MAQIATNFHFTDHSLLLIAYLPTERQVAFSLLITDHSLLTCLLLSPTLSVGTSHASCLLLIALCLLITDHSLLTLLPASHPIPDPLIDFLRYVLMETFIQYPLLIFRIA